MADYPVMGVRLFVDLQMYYPIDEFCEVLTFKTERKSLSVYDKLNLLKSF